jgi:hypothetical protein
MIAGRVCHGLPGAVPKLTYATFIHFRNEGRGQSGVQGITALLDTSLDWHGLPLDHSCSSAIPVD